MFSSASSTTPRYAMSRKSGDVLRKISVRWLCLRITEAKTTTIREKRRDGGGRRNMGNRKRKRRKRAENTGSRK